MNVADARTLIAYDEWANERLMEALSGLDEEQFTRPLVSSFPSIRDTLAHVVAVEWVWLQRWLGQSPTAPPPWAERPSLAELRERLAEIEAERGEFLDGLSDADLQAQVDYRNLKGGPGSARLGELVQHLVNHSSYHRGQLTTLMRQVGATGPATDFVLFTTLTRT